MSSRARKSQESTRAAIYARKSTEDRKRPGKSVADQLREARSEASMRGYALDDALEFVDDGISASRHAKGKLRPGYAALVAAIEARDVDVLVMAEQSRASRRLSVIGALFEMCAEYSVKLVIGGRDVDPSNPTDWLLLGVTAGMDAAESERTRERVLRGVRNSAEQGRPAGKNMYGYARKYNPVTGELLAVEPEPHESAVVREIVGRLLRGDALNQIASDLNSRGEASPYDAVSARCGRDLTGAAWVGTQVRRLALSPAYAGLRTHRGELTEAMWPAIIDMGDHERVKAILSNPTRRTNAGVRPGAVMHWLSGVAKCGECGHGLRVLTNRGAYRTYLCPDCFKVARSAPALEAHVEGFIFELVRRPDILNQIAAANDSGEKSKAAVSRSVELVARRDSIRELIVSGQLPAADGAAMLSALSADIESAERAVRSIAMPRNIADVISADLAESWDSFSPARKREIADALLDVRVLSMNGRKSRKFLPEFVEVRPRGAA